MLNRIKSTERQGEILIVIEIILWSFFPVITILSYNEVSPLVSLAWSTFFASIFFAGILTLKKKWHELRNTAALKDILMVTLLIGVLFYSLFFTGLKYTTAGNASIIALAEVLFSYVFFQMLRKEQFSKSHAIGALFLVIGGIIVLLPGAGALNKGDLLIVFAVISAPLGNFFQRRARKHVSSETILFIRSALSAIFIFVLALFFKEDMSLAKVQNSLIFLMINGVILLGISKVLWIEVIHRISVTKASALTSIGPLLTLVYAWMLIGEVPTVLQIAAFIPMFVGVLFITKQNKTIVPSLSSKKTLTS